MSLQTAKMKLWQSLTIGRIVAFVVTFVLSLAIESALPKAREQRQRSFAQAAMNGDLARMRLLHLAGARINARGNCCMPLFLAAGEGRIEVVRYLLDEGADVDAREKLGDTALTEAAYYGRLDVAKELLFRGAEINTVGDEGTALDIATNKNYASIAELLRHHGAKRACEVRKCD